MFCWASRSWKDISWAFDSPFDGSQIYSDFIGGSSGRGRNSWPPKNLYWGFARRILQALRRVESHNPVFMLDEIDKLSTSFQGDPASALLEVLDPEQNSEFRDHYLEVGYDLSQVMFITTANWIEKIPGPLRDRMEIITLSGYTEREKIEIAKGYLIPRQLRENSLREVGDFFYQ